MSARCEWCGVFVTADTLPTVTRVFVRWFNPTWRELRQLLCPRCRYHRHHEASWVYPSPYDGLTHRYPS